MQQEDLAARLPDMERDVTNAAEQFAALEEELKRDDRFVMVCQKERKNMKEKERARQNKKRERRENTKQNQKKRNQRKKREKKTKNGKIKKNKSSLIYQLDIEGKDRHTEKN